MSNSTTLLTVLALEENRSSILIDEVYAQSFYTFLLSKEFRALEPSAVIFSPKRWYRDHHGEINMESEPTNMKIIVEASPGDIESVLEEWISTIRGV
jgi:hypothetical protein